LEANLHIKLSDGYDIGDLDDILANEFAYVRSTPVGESWIFYDTFDWLLFSKSLTLHQSGGMLLLRRLPEGETAQKLTSSSIPVFASDLPDSPLKDQLVGIIHPRALLNLAEINIKSHTYRILNANQKTVARLVFTEAHTPDEAGVTPISTYLSLLPVRGYPKYARQLGEFIKQQGEPTSVWEDVYQVALAAAGETPGSYTSKLDLYLDPDMRSEQATKIILRRLLEVMKANEPGLRADIDTEFLHDFRVSIRRTRSALGQIKGVFPADVVARFKGEFAYLGKSTNKLRDLDVYLLAEDSYRAMLSEGLRDDISPLFDHLGAQREGALGEVIEVLDSDRYAQILHDWDDFLTEPVRDEIAGGNAALPIIETARKRIYKRYRRVIKDGNAVLENPQDELMHALRIECKKLRYLIEFFASLFPPKKVARLVDQLKKLQDNLGEFNDLSVQQEYLLNIVEELPIHEPGTRRALVATGYLIDNLAHRQQVVRDDFAETFTTFASQNNQGLFRKLYAYKEKRPGS
jgi:CHAD domain-containing protein